MFTIIFLNYSQRLEFMEEKRENFDEIYYPSNINEIVYKDTDIKVVE